MAGGELMPDVPTTEAARVVAAPVLEAAKPQSPTKEAHHEQMRRKMEQRRALVETEDVGAPPAVQAQPPKMQVPPASIDQAPTAAASELPGTLATGSDRAPAMPQVAAVAKAMPAATLATTPAAAPVTVPAAVPAALPAMATAAASQATAVGAEPSARTGDSPTKESSDDDGWLLDIPSTSTEVIRPAAEASLQQDFSTGTLLANDAVQDDWISAPTAADTVGEASGSPRPAADSGNLQDQVVGGISVSDQTKDPLEDDDWFTDMLDEEIATGAADVAKAAPSPAKPAAAAASATGADSTPDFLAAAEKELEDK